MKWLFTTVAFMMSFSTFSFAETISFQEEVRVVTSKPEYRAVTTRTPYQECWDEHIESRRHEQPTNSDGTVGALIGGVAGGILGHQVGGGSGKTAATVGGAIVGTLVGKNLAENNTGSTEYSPQHRTERKCVTRYEERTADKFIGYKNVAHYKGETIVKYSEKPLEYIRLHINVSY